MTLPPADIRAIISGRPALLRLHDAVVEGVKEFSDAVAVRGGLTRGRFDRYSDLDLAVMLPEQKVSQAVKVVDEIVYQCGTVLSCYPAAHRSMPWLHVYTLLLDGSVTKVDISFEFGGEPTSPSEVIVWQRPHFAGHPPADAGHGLDVRLALERCVGWTWYIHTKIGRGELIEAERALSMFRLIGLIPLLRHAESLPQEDARWLETVLPPAVLERLLSTYPASVTAPELHRAMIAAVGCLTACCESLGEPEIDDHVRRLNVVVGHIRTDRSAR